MCYKQLYWFVLYIKSCFLFQNGKRPAKKVSENVLAANSSYDVLAEDNVLPEGEDNVLPEGLGGLVDRFEHTVRKKTYILFQTLYYVYM